MLLQVKILWSLKGFFREVERVDAVQGIATNLFLLVEGYQIPSLLEKLQCKRLATVMLDVIGAIVSPVLHLDFKALFQGFHERFKMLNAAWDALKLHPLAQTEV